MSSYKTFGFRQHLKAVSLKKKAVAALADTTRELSEYLTYQFSMQAAYTTPTKWSSITMLSADELVALNEYKSKFGV